MQARSLVRAFLILYVTIGVVVWIESVATVVAAVRGELPTLERPHALVLGGVEVVAAVLFLIPGTMRWGAAGLLVIFALAFGIHAAGGDLNLDLLIFAAAVLFVRTHGVHGYRWAPSAV
jgi:hypothetical protein